MKAEPISHYIGKLHDRGIKAATLLGKGPTLDFHTPFAGEYVMGVNNVSPRKRCDAVVFSDSKLDRWSFDPAADLIRTAESKESHEGRGYYFERGARPGSPYNPAAIPRDLRLGSGTKALAILALAGVEHVTLWGFDGGVPQLGGLGYAKCLGDDELIGTPGKHAVEYGPNLLHVCYQPWSAIRLLEHGTARGTITLWEDLCQPPLG